MKRFLIWTMMFLVLYAGISCDQKVDPPVQWSVTFDTDGGSMIRTATVEDGGTVQFPPDPEKDDCLFKGWYDENGEVFDFSQPITGDITVYAHWIRRAYHEQLEQIYARYEIMNCLSDYDPDINSFVAMYSDIYLLQIMGYLYCENDGPFTDPYVMDGRDKYLIYSDTESSIYSRYKYEIKENKNANFVHTSNLKDGSDVQWVSMNGVSYNVCLEDTGDTYNVNFDALITAGYDSETHEYIGGSLKLYHDYIEEPEFRLDITDNGYLMTYGDWYYEHEHTWGEWFEAYPPEDERPGTERRICTVCKAEDEREIPKLNYRNIQLLQTESQYNGKPLNVGNQVVFDDDIGSLYNVEYKPHGADDGEYTLKGPVAIGMYDVRVTVFPDEKHLIACVKEFQYEIIQSLLDGGYYLSGLFPAKEYNGNFQTWTTILGSTGDEGCDVEYDKIAKGERIQITFTTNGAAVGDYFVSYPRTVGSSGVVSVVGLDGTDLNNYQMNIQDCARIEKRTIDGELTFRKNYNGLATVDVTDLTSLSNLLPEDKNATLRITLYDADADKIEKKILRWQLLVDEEDKTKYYYISIEEQLHIYIDPLIIM